MMRRGFFWIVAGAIVIFVGLVAGVPVQTKTLVSHRRPLKDYAAAMAEMARLQRDVAATVAPGGATILLTHGQRTPVVALLLHGFTNSPRQFDSLGAMLYRDGANVYIPRLPHHAERAGDANLLARITAEELCAAADSAMDIAEALGDTVVVVGLSLGGTMAAWIAQNRPGATRAIIIAPLMALARVPLLLDGPFRNLTVRLPNFTNRQRQDARQPDRELGWTTRALGQILRLGLATQRVASRLPPASRAIAIVLNADDHTIAPEPVVSLAESWAAHGAHVHIYEVPSTLGLPHDVIDPRQPIRRLDIVYPAIMNLVRGERPPRRGLELRWAAPRE